MGILHRQHLLGKLTAIDRVDNREQIPVPRGAQLNLSVPDKTEGYVGIAEGNFIDDVGNSTGLGAVLFEKFHASGGVVEHIPDYNGSTRRTTGIGKIHLLTAVDHIAAAGDALRCAGEHLHPTDGGNGSQCLPTETKGSYAVEVLRSGHLAGSMADKGGRQVLLLNTGTVIGDTDVTDASVFDLNSDLLGTGIDGVFQQFLDDRRRPLHHLTGGNELCHLWRQNMDTLGHGLPSCKSSSHMPPSRQGIIFSALP